MKTPKSIVRDMISDGREYSGAPAGDYLKGVVTEKEHMKKYGEGKCKKCGKGTGRPKGYTNYCYECGEGE
jgi:hypothetical protein